MMGGKAAAEVLLACRQAGDFSKRSTRLYQQRWMELFGHDFKLVGDPAGMVGAASFCLHGESHSRGPRGRRCGGGNGEVGGCGGGPPAAAPARGAQPCDPGRGTAWPTPPTTPNRLLPCLPTLCTERTSSLPHACSPRRAPS